MTTTSQNGTLAREVSLPIFSKVPGLADGSGWTMYDATSDLAFYDLCMMDA